MNTSIKQIKVSPTISGTTMPLVDRYSSNWNNLEYINTTTVQEMVEPDASGTQNIYTLQHTPIKCKIFLVFINGLLQRENIDYSVIKNQIIFAFNVHAHRNIIVNYTYFDEFKGIQYEQ